MVSHYKQATLLDCGMACVKTIISYYFPKLEHLDSLQFDNNNHQGLSLFDIEDILKSYGIDADSYQIETPSLLNNVSFPYLLVVERASLPHYIVVLDGDSSSLIVSDPANEEIEKISRLELFSQSVGIVLIPQKNENVNSEDRKDIVIPDISSDELVDMLEEADEVQKKDIFEHLDEDDKDDIKELLEYPSDTAGGIMATEFLAIDEDMTMDKTIAFLGKSAPDYETPYYLYVVGKGNILFYFPIGT